MDQDARASFLQDLTMLFEKAVAEGQLALALRIKEVMGKVMGLLGVQAVRYRIKPIDQWSDQDMQSILTQLETRLCILPGLDPAYHFNPPDALPITPNTAGPNSTDANSVGPNPADSHLASPNPADSNPVDSNLTDASPVGPSQKDLLEQPCGQGQDSPPFLPAPPNHKPNDK
jgi:hypothetical protein